MSAPGAADVPAPDVPLEVLGTETEASTRRLVVTHATASSTRSLLGDRLGDRLDR
jgi:hypothetical protein